MHQNTNYRHSSSSNGHAHPLKTVKQDGGPLGEGGNRVFELFKHWFLQCSNELEQACLYLFLVLQHLKHLIGTEKVQLAQTQLLKI